MSILRGGPFEAVCDHLMKRRSSILLAWREASEADPAQRTARALTRSQFNDHVPEVLDAFEQKLRAEPGSGLAAAASREEKAEEVKHGLHRWQQGYQLQELMCEWGHLQLCLFEELDAFAAANPDFPRAALAEVNRRMITLVNEAISQSAAQYERMQRAEAASHMGSLREALDRVQAIERGRAVLIHQAVHDITSNVFGVRLAATLLGEAGIAEAPRTEFAQLLKEGVHSVSTMLEELMELARLEAGQEQREITDFDASALLTALAALNQPVARERGLQLALDGPPELTVAGDARKVQRLLQNLVGNALKYTTCGGVHLSWGVDEKSWWLKVSDTGPGLSTGAGAALVVGLKEATASAREIDVKSAALEGEIAQVLTPATTGPANPGNPAAAPGEGIGLSIVKRLCELLDASLEVASSANSGTTIRVVLPRQYPGHRAG